MKVKFKETMYEVIGNVINVMPDHFQATVKKEEHTIDEIIEDAVGNDVITTYDDEGELMGTYNGYKDLIAVCTMDGYNVSVELKNTSMQEQINALMATQSSQGNRLEQVADVANDLVNSQATQDLAIEDLGEVVSDLIPEEE